MDRMNKDLLDKLILFTATGFGLGRAPVAPGTFGTLAALPLVWIMALLNPLHTGFFLICLVLAAISIANRAEILMGQKDPGAIVIDEMAGYCVTLSLVVPGPVSIGAGFLAFRCFDILKPWPVRYFEKKYSGGAGVVLDDIMAGVMAAVVLKILNLTGLL
ncbi:phosphatidylglycerophosphatase A family protein [Desulfospira joergensenii]|uniref:phosphatidylglycerophosphatase A family protein n=1 Tax=Desulfospira joergensenii TaxID=53329 RepID=UPI0003B60222|nr:phosphatidylglycerophosphatase A [Desulfospira joergensenii]